MRRALPAAVIGALAALALLGIPAGASASASSGPAMFYVGFAKRDITPPVPFSYLGGQGYLRVGTTVLAPLWVRTLAIQGADAHGRRVGSPAVISVLDSQGYFAGYQSGPGGTGVADYGLDQIRAAAGAAAHVPAANISFSATHSHTAPDTMGVWGGSPSSYMEQLKSAAVASVSDAVASMQPAWIRHGQADGAQYIYNPIPTSVPPDQYSDPNTWPQYTALTVLQALKWGTSTPIVTLFDFGTHPDILEGSPLVSPDWPSLTIDHINATYGGDSMFMPGVEGSEPVFPGGDNQPHTNAYLESEESIYAGQINGVVDSAIASAGPVDVGGVAASETTAAVPATNALLMADDVVDAPDEVHSQLGLGHIRRAVVPPYLYGNVLRTPVSAVRIGDGVLLNTPGEVYSDVFFSARDQIGAAWYLVGGLANDQIGYVVMPAEFPVAEAYGPTGPAASYAVGPSVGAQIVRGLTRTARAAGLPVTPKPALLVADQDPVAAQMQYCVTSGACQQSVP